MIRIVPHSVIRHAQWYVDGTIHTNTIESFWALLKRGMFGQRYNPKLWIGSVKKAAYPFA